MLETFVKRADNIRPYGIIGNVSSFRVIARSAATWQSPGTILSTAVHFDGWYQEIAPQGYFLALRAQGATPFRARNDI